ncbi:polymorphic toxin-type HINT domain-containing protein [Paenibacillus sp. NPDC057934]|uniref:polymorphic toxin-type HINT domain-containing protein n=1 Tax=Paenibacillus sp. NPDC057934 TaxID=3346282 RepID=UPI0036D97548
MFSFLLMFFLASFFGYQVFAQQNNVPQQQELKKGSEGELRNGHNLERSLLNINSGIDSRTYPDKELVDKRTQYSKTFDLGNEVYDVKLVDQDGEQQEESSEQDDSSVTEDVYLEGVNNFLSMAVEKPPVLEKPPVYNKTSFNEAPYAIGINNENVSSMSGGLSIENDDLSLPGRNGLSFTLTRKYDSNSAQFFGMDYNYRTFNYDSYDWGVTYNAIKKDIINKYDVYMRENLQIEYDYNGDGSVDNRSILVEQPKRNMGTYGTENEARQRVNQIPSLTYTVPSDTLEINRTVTSTSNIFNSYLFYNSNGYGGTLYTSGGSYVSGGSYIPAQSKTAKDSCDNIISGAYNSSGKWEATSQGTSCPSTKTYNEGGYAGELSRTGTTTNKDCPTNGTPGYKCTKSFTANYSGTVTKPSVDTREYTQNYRGNVTRASYTSTDRYEGWVNDGNGRTRKVYSRYGAAWVEQKPHESNTGTPIRLGVYELPEYSDAVYVVNYINASAGEFIAQGDSGGVTSNYYYSTSPNPEIINYKSGEGVGYEYYNSTTKPLEEKLYPIGKGWSWKLPYVEYKDEKPYVHLAEGGSYEVENSTLKNYDWLGVTFTPDSSVNVNGLTSTSVLSSADGTEKQYFDKEGRLIQIADAYNNTIQFFYDQNPTYGLPLLSRVKDSIGNEIQISYTASEVVLSKGNQKITYSKHTQDGVELLDVVKDAEGRKTTYNYQIKNAQFNLLSNYGERALSNPYALLSKVQHPTGAATEYNYEPQPVRRFIGESSYNEAYRLSSRRDLIFYDNGTSKEFNRHSLFYNNSDMGSSYNQNMSFSTTLNDGLTETTFNYKKIFINNETPSQYYLDSSVQSAGGMEKKTAYTYDKYVGSRGYAASVPTRVTATDNKTSDVIAVANKYDDYGNVVESTDEKDRTQTLTYDNRHLLLTALKPVNNGAFTYTEYSRNNQGSITQLIVRKDNASGEILQQVNFNNIDNYGNPTVQSVLNGTKTITTNTTYDQNHAFPKLQQVNVTDVKGQVSQVIVEKTYDPATGLVSSFIDGNDRLTRYATKYTYDKLGRVLTVTYPDYSNISAVYDDKNNTVTVTDETGGITRTSWNALGLQMETGIIAQGIYQKKTFVDYDGFGRAQSSQDALENTTQYKYDLWSRPIHTIYPDLSQSSVEYNDITHTASIKDAEGYIIEETANKWGQVESRGERLSASAALKPLERINYNPWNDQVMSHTDGEGNTTSFSYDYNGSLTSVTNAKKEVTQYTYDMFGNQLSTTYPSGEVKRKAYDELGRVISSTDELGLNNQYTYDANGNVLTSTDRNGTVLTMLYDRRDRLKERVSPDETVTFMYDSAGRRTKMKDNLGETSYDYDPYAGYITQVKYSDGLTLEIPEYDANGNRKKMVDPFGETIDYSYDGMNRLVTIAPGGSNTTPIASYTYYRNSLPNLVSKINGVESKSKYTGLDLTQLEQSNKGLRLNLYQYTYDLNKNIQTRTTNNVSDSYKYDELDRISSSTGSSNLAYSYDKRGNRVSLEGDSTFGELKDTEYTYDKQNRLTRVNSEGSAVQYRYNGNGLLVEREERGEIIRYYYDGDQIIAEAKVVNGVPQKVASYIRGQRLEAIKYNDSTTAYPTYNGHGDVVELRDENGDILNKYDYDIWGNITYKDEKVHNPFRYSGELWDDTTHLQYLRARWYDPSVGRFLNEDTFEGDINNPLSLNLYTYVSNNPLIYVDPSGNVWSWVGNTWKAVKTGTVAVANFLVVDDIRTILDPNASTFDKALSAASFVPFGKVVKGGSLVIKLINKEGRIIERAVEKTASNEQAIAKVLKGCNCFVAGTKVLTDKGEKNIEDIEVGDKVLAKDENNPDGEVDYKEVTNLYRNQRDDIIKLYVGEQIIETTDNHPFWVEGKGWVFADELQVGDKLQKADGSNLTVNKVELVKLNEPVTVYNFTVADYHTYYVTDLGIWVHNTNCFSGSATDLANFANKSKKIDGLPGAVVPLNQVYDAGKQFVGSGYSTIQKNGYTWYTSSNGLKRVRVGTKASKPGEIEANYETFKNPFDFSRDNQLTNYHVTVQKP